MGRHITRCVAAVLLSAALAMLISGCAGSEARKVVVETSAKPAPATPGVTTAPTPTSTPDGGDKKSCWYGWWRMYSTSGDWSRMYGYWWDCCATLTETSDGEYTLWLWDEDIPKETGLVELKVRGSGGELECAGGRFMDTKLAEGGCNITIRDSDGGRLLTLSGKYKEDNGSFKYYFQLRQWGDSWDGSDKDETPYYLESWYRPLIEAGKPMPDSIGSKKAASSQNNTQNSKSQ